MTSPMYQASARFMPRNASVALTASDPQALNCAGDDPHCRGCPPDQHVKSCKKPFWNVSLIAMQVKNVARPTRR